MEFQLLVSLHQGHINKTPTERFGAVENSCHYQPAELPIDALIEHIKAGKAWVGCQLANGKRNDDNAGGSNLIVLDIDGDIQLEAFWTNSFAARHCLLTYTSCSHVPDGEHRFRALFRCEVHSNADLHRAIYQQVVDAMGFVPKDSSGSKPERLWYGNTSAEVRLGGGKELSWDLVDQAHRELTAELERRANPKNELVDDGLKLERIAYVLANLLRPSEEGQYEYWASVLNCAAASGSEPIKQAFFTWHEKGFHGTGGPGKPAQRMNSRRYDRAGKKAEPGHILRLIKQQHGSDWWRQLPENLWFGGAGATRVAPTSLMRSRPALDEAPAGAPFSIPKNSATGPDPSTVPMRSCGSTEIAPTGGTASFSEGADSTAIPITVPSRRELEQLHQQAKPRNLMCSGAVKVEVAERKTSALQEPLTLDQKLRRLYFLRTNDLLQIGDNFQQVLPHEFAALDRELLGDLLMHPGYCNQPAEVEHDLLAIFRQEHSFCFNPRAQVKRFTLDGRGRECVTWLIPNFILAGGEHVLYSKGGVGKTILAIHMARALSGDPEVTHFLDSGTFSNRNIWQRHKIVFIGSDMESSAEKVTNSYLQSMKLEGKPFLKQIEWLFEDKDAGTPAWKLCLKDLDDLYNFLESEKAKGTPVPAVFIDSMKAVCPDHLLVGHQAFKDYLKLIKDICCKFGAALIWIHHSRGDGSGAQGIQRITEGSDANFHFKKDEKTNQYSLEIEKIRGGAKSRTVIFNPFAEGGPTVSSQSAPSPSDHGSAIEKQMILKAIAKDLEHHRLRENVSEEKAEKTYPGMKPGEIEKAIREDPNYRTVSRRTLDRWLKELVAANLISGKGRYRLVANSRVNQVNQPSLSELDDDSTGDIPGWS